MLNLAIDFKCFFERCFHRECVFCLHLLCCAAPLKNSFKKFSQFYLLFFCLLYFPAHARAIQDPFTVHDALSSWLIAVQPQLRCYNVLPMGVGSCFTGFIYQSTQSDSQRPLIVDFDTSMKSKGLIASPDFISSLSEYPYSRSYLQQRSIALWKEGQRVEKSIFDGKYVTPNMFEHLGFEQVVISLPRGDFYLNAPFFGEYQYYSQQGNLLNNAMSFDIELPSVQPLNLSMKARWQIEEDYDYSQVLVDGVAIAGNQTKASNPMNHARNILTGSSVNVIESGASSPWVDLNYDLSGYAGRNVRITINYVTDEAKGYDGILIDDIAVNQGEGDIYLNGAELNDKMSLVGFERVSNQMKDKLYMMHHLDDMKMAFYTLNNTF
ncbi:immune inhibitor A domain-containing protein [uncultured Shewanella sp.]|uniref:immune inhibitor A domain-containing protein n=1 Tax=uncultured Shewanella sp. TaxID=173975 RepID=UPI00260BA7D7|nr:immune inhibitor A domain-containing protein [uncultured Shewanella sp.]